MAAPFGEGGRPGTVHCRLPLPGVAHGSRQFGHVSTTLFEGLFECSYYEDATVAWICLAIETGELVLSPHRVQYLRAALRDAVGGRPGCVGTAGHAPRPPCPLPLPRPQASLASCWLLRFIWTTGGPTRELRAALPCCLWLPRPVAELAGHPCAPLLRLLRRCWRVPTAPRPSLAQLAGGQAGAARGQADHQSLTGPGDQVSWEASAVAGELG